MLLRTDIMSPKRKRYIIVHGTWHRGYAMKRLEGIRFSFYLRRNLHKRLQGSLLPYPELIARYRQAITDFAASEKPRLP